MPPKKATSVNSGGGSGGKKAAKSSTTSKRNGSGQPRRKAENVKVRGRVPALAATILRTRDLDPRLKPFPQQADDDDILPWCETFLNVCHLPPLAMLDPGFRDARGRAPSETELTDIREFMRIVKEDPEICSKKPMAEIPGNKAWTRWAWRTWVPLMAAAVRAVLAKNGDTWTQRQMKSERKHSVDLTAGSVAGRNAEALLEALFGDAAFNNDRHARPLAGMCIVMNDMVYRVCDQEKKRWSTLRPALESARGAMAKAISVMDDPSTLDVNQFKKAIEEANELRAIFAQIGIEAEEEDEKLLENFSDITVKVLASKEKALKDHIGSADQIFWSEDQILEANNAYGIHFLSGDTLLEMRNDEALSEAVLGAGDLGVQRVMHDKPTLYKRLGIPSDGQIPHLKPFEAVKEVPAGGPKIPWNFESLLEWAREHLPIDQQTTPAQMLHPIPSQRALLEEERLARGCPQTHRLIRGHLHQIQGVAAIAEQAFKDTAKETHVATLIADSMGLGKTLTAITYALLVVHWFQVQGSLELDGREMPTHFANRYWCGLKNIPNAPTVIVVPNNLLVQWVGELRSFVQPALIDILVFDPRGQGEADRWWKAVYGRSSSRLQACRCVIVTTPNALKREADRLLTPTTRSRGNFYGGTFTRQADAQKLNIFTLKPNVVIIDEGHGYRNLNRDAHAVLTLSLSARHTVCLTGTPVYNATIDLIALACILGIPEFNGGGYLAKKDEIKKMIPKRRTKASLSSEADLRQHVLAAQQKLVEDNKDAIAKLTDWFTPVIIRRTMDSLDPYGNRILRPIENTVRMSYVKLSDDEEERTNAMCDEVKDTEKGGTSRVFKSGKFYTEYRLCLQFSEHSTSRSRNQSVVSDASQWDVGTFKKKQPSKMLRVLEILDYHIPQPLRTPINPEDDISPLKDRLRTALEWSFMTGERLPHLSADDLDAAWKVQAGLPDAPDLAPLPDSPIAHEATSSSIPIVGAIRRTKVIITLTYTLYLPILKRLLELHGYSVRTFTGDTPPKDRGRIIQEFNMDAPHPSDDGRLSNILIMSGIGITGLNFTRGCVMIHFDQTWSQQEEDQATHRIVRLGQVEHCIIYKVLALGTTDIWMNQIASGKELMLDLFSGNVKSTALQALKNPHLLDIKADEDSADVEKAQTFDPSTIQTPPSNAEEDENPATTPSLPFLPPREPTVEPEQPCDDAQELQAFPNVGSTQPSTARTLETPQQQQGVPSLVSGIEEGETNMVVDGEDVLVGPAKGTRKRDLSSSPEQEDPHPPKRLTIVRNVVGTSGAARGSGLQASRPPSAALRRGAIRMPHQPSSMPIDDEIESESGREDDVTTSFAALKAKRNRRGNSGGNAL